MNEINNEILNGLINVLPRFEKRFIKVINEVLADQGVSKAHLDLMFILKERGKLTMSELGKILYVSKPNITILVDKLSNLNFVARSFDTKDRRVIYIDLTKAGEDFLTEHIKSINLILMEDFSKLEKDDIELFKNTINNLSLLLKKLKI